MDGWWELRAKASQRLRDNAIPEIVEDIVKFRINGGKHELNDADRQHIARLLKEGYTSGEIVHEEEEKLRS